LRTRERLKSKVFVSFLPAALTAISIAQQKALVSAADVGRNKVVSNLSGARSGHQYKVPGTNTYYTASAPGEFPAAPTGRLRSHVERKSVGQGIQIGTAVEYGLTLEKSPGNRGGRPWLKRSLDQAKPAMILELAKRWF